MHLNQSEADLSLIKPVLKRNFFHLGNSVIVSWKSFEVWLINQEKSTHAKVLNPLYLPLLTASRLITMKEEEIKNVIEEGLKLS